MHRPASLADDTFSQFWIKRLGCLWKATGVSGIHWVMCMETRSLCRHCLPFCGVVRGCTWTFLDLLCIHFAISLIGQHAFVHPEDCGTVQQHKLSLQKRISRGPHCTRISLVLSLLTPQFSRTAVFRLETRGNIVGNTHTHTHTHTLITIMKF